MRPKVTTLNKLILRTHTSRVPLEEDSSTAEVSFFLFRRNQKVFSTGFSAENPTKRPPISNLLVESSIFQQVPSRALTL